MLQVVPFESVKKWFDAHFQGLVYLFLFACFITHSKYVFFGHADEVNKHFIGYFPDSAP